MSQGVYDISEGVVSTSGKVDNISGMLWLIRELVWHKFPHKRKLPLPGRGAV